MGDGCFAFEQITYDDQCNLCFTLEVADFATKMRTWPSGRRIKSKPFKVEDVSLSLSLYPNGVKGYGKHVVVLLVSDANSTPIYVEFKIQVGRKVLSEKGMIKPGCAVGAPQWLPHKTLSLHKSEVMTVKLTIQEVWTKAFKNLNDNVSEVHVKLEMLEKKLDGVIKMKKALSPRCPICFEKMGTSTKIAQCLSGHFLCWTCKSKLRKKVCPSCNSPVNGRAYGMESFLRGIEYPWMNN